METNVFDATLAKLDFVDYDELIEIYNVMAENALSDKIFYMSELDDILTDWSPSDIGYAIFDGDFRIIDNYFMVPSQSRIISFNDPTSVIDSWELAEYMVKNKSLFPKFFD